MTQEETKLVFHRYGEEYFLAQIWPPVATLAVNYPKSQRERTVRRELAKNSTKNEGSARRVKG